MHKNIFILALALCFAVNCSDNTLPKGCEDFVIDAPKDNGGLVVKASDYGFSTRSDKNATAINLALEKCREMGASRLELDEGTYRCFDEPGIVIEDFSDFTVDGKGAVLVFRRDAEYRCQPQSELVLDKGNMGIRRCKRTVIENFTMDWDWENSPLAAHVRVEGKNVDEEHPEESYVDLCLTDYSRYPLCDAPVPVQILIPMDSTGTHFRKGSAHYFGMTEGHFGARNEWIKPNVLRLWPGIPMEGRNQNPATGFTYSPEKNLQKVDGFVIGEHFKLQHCYYGKNGINMESNIHLLLKDVNIWSCFGMALVVDGEQQYWQVENVRVVPPAKEEFEAAYPGTQFFERPVTSTSDGHHVARSKGWCRYIGCRWTRNNDDASNFHDRFTIAARASDKVLDIINKRGNDYFRVIPGAEIELRHPDYSPTGFRARVERIEGNRIFTDRKLPKQKGQCFLVWDRTYGTDHVLMSGCEFIDIGGRTIFSPSHLTIENCTYRNVMGLGIRIIADYRLDRWCEGMGASDIVIRGCSFENTCIKYPENPVLSAQCVFPDDWNVRHIAPGFVGGNMLIEGNTFINPTGPAIDLPVGDNVTVRNNTIDLRGVTDTTGNAGLIRTTTSGKVHIYGNSLLQ